MALLFMEGFDYYTTTTTTVAPHGWTMGQTKAFNAGRFGGQCLSNSRYVGSGLVSSVALPSTATTMIVGWAQNSMSATTYFEILTAANAVVASVRNNAGNPAVYNAAGSLVATGTSGAVTGWHYYELKIIVNGASGSCELRVDGIEDIAATTGNFGSTAIGAIGLFINAGTALNIDDIYVLDTTGDAPTNTFLGDVRVTTVMPTEPGTYSQWTPNGAAANWDCVNDPPPADSDTTYISDSTPGNIDSYVFADIDGGATVYGVQVNIFGRKDDATTRQIAPLIRQASTDYAGATVTLASGYAYYSQLYEQDPTASAWTAATVNADEFGVKEIA